MTPRLGELMERELARFRHEHPRSLELTERAKASLLGGVPMHWMVRWAGGFPVFARGAAGGSFGPPVGPAETTRMVEFNDVEALERELAHGDVACVLAEPALTNIGIVLPEPGYHDALREATRRHGTLLIIDETHTICAGPGGYTAAHGLDPDVLTIGKAIAAGIPAAAYGFSEEVARGLGERLTEEQADVGGIGGTLAANVLSLAAMRATLGEVLTN